MRYDYDELGNLIKTIGPDGQEIAHLSYGAGHIYGIALNKKDTIGFKRDDLHRETECYLANGLIQSDHNGKITACGHYGSYYSSIIDFLQRIGTATGRPALIRFSSNLIRSGAYRTIAFLGSVVWLARLNLIILGLTAVEIVYKALIADNKLEVWCRKSAFGVDVVKYENEGSELEAFNEAFADVIGIR